MDDEFSDFTQSPAISPAIQSSQPPLMKKGLDISPAPISSTSPSASASASGQQGPLVPGGDDGDLVEDFLAREANLKIQLGEEAPIPLEQHGGGGMDIDFTTGGDGPVFSAPLSGTQHHQNGQQGTSASSLSSSQNTSSFSKQPAIEDSEVLKEWKKQFTSALEAKDETSRSRQHEQAQKARLEIDQFYNEYNVKKTKQIQRNRDSQAAFVKSRSAAAASAGKGDKQLFWEKVWTVIESVAPIASTSTSAANSGNASSKSTQNAPGDGQQGRQAPQQAVSVSAQQADSVKRDTVYMKSLLMQLKHDPKAPCNIKA